MGMTVGDCLKLIDVRKPSIPCAPTFSRLGDLNYVRYEKSAEPAIELACTPFSSLLAEGVTEVPALLSQQ